MYNVLLIDDEKIITEGLKILIKKSNLGFETFQIAEDVESAITTLNDYCPDVIFTDIKMDGVDGLQFTENIRNSSGPLEDIPIVIVSGYSDFKYAKKAIRNSVIEYLTKPIDEAELYEVLKKVKSIIDYKKEKLVSYNINKDFFDITNFKHFKNNSNYYSVIFENIYLIKLMIPTVLYQNDHLRLQDIFIDVVQEKFKSKKIQDFFCYKIEATNFFIISYKNLIEDMFFESCLQDTLLGLREGESYDARLLISSPFNDIELINEAYNEVKSIDRYKKAFDIKKKIITYYDIKKKQKSGPILFNQIRDILTGIENCDLELVMGQFSYLKKYVDNNPDFSLEYVESMYIDICLEMYKNFYSEQACKDCESIFESALNIKTIIDQSESYDEMHSIVRKIVLDFVEFNKKYKNKIKNTNELSLIIKKYIDMNYHLPDCSLMGISRKLNITNNYLGYIYKRDTGTSFNSYLSKIRVEKSIELLKNDKLNIIEISKKIGYTSEKHFYVVFKRLMGTSPDKYRSKMKQIDIMLDK